MRPAAFAIWMRLWMVGMALGLVGLTSCASPQINPALISAPVNTPPATIVVTGNQACHPAQDLPAEKSMKKVPEKATAMEDLYALFAQERSAHAQDDRDYNALWAQCVGPAAK
jgi:hypothetical protein